MQHNDKVTLEKILTAINDATEVLGNIAKEEFLKNKTLNLAMGMSIIRVGELVKNLSEEIRKENPKIEWKAIAGFSDIVAHKYEILDFFRGYITIKDEFPELKPARTPKKQRIYTQRQ